MSTVSGWPGARGLPVVGFSRQPVNARHTATVAGTRAKRIMSRPPGRRRWMKPGGQDSNLSSRPECTPREVTSGGGLEPEDHLLVQELPDAVEEGVAERVVGPDDPAVDLGVGHQQKRVPVVVGRDVRAVNADDAEHDRLRLVLVVLIREVLGVQVLVIELALALGARPGVAGGQDVHPEEITFVVSLGRVAERLEDLPGMLLRDLEDDLPPAVHVPDAQERVFGTHGLTGERLDEVLRDDRPQRPAGAAGRPGGRGGDEVVARGIQVALVPPLVAAQLLTDPVELDLGEGELLLPVALRRRRLPRGYCRILLDLFPG